MAVTDSDAHVSHNLSHALSRIPSVAHAPRHHRPRQDHFQRRHRHRHRQYHLQHCQRHHFGCRDRVAM